MATTQNMWSIKTDRGYWEEMGAWEQEALENYFVDVNSAVQYVWQYKSKLMEALVSVNNTTLPCTYFAYESIHVCMSYLFKI